jgi:meso-butanediol dehydrogenase / (S,S)-butanediol dehydrogenase / diacetyl reductase
MRLQGKVALITGGGTGIGAAVTKRFVEEGARVCITGRRRELLEEVSKRLPAGSVAICVGDVANHDDARRMVEAAIKLGGLDVLVNNAGMDPAGTVVDLDLKTWQRVLEVNMTGPFLLMKEAIPHMIKAGGGSIINMASLAGIRCIPAMPAYCSSKAGLIHLTKQVALDYGPQKIRCNVICPGAIRTEMLENSIGGHLGKTLNTDTEGAFKYFTQFSPLRRAGIPDEITGLCVYLAGDESLFMTGAELVIDGGTAIVDANGAAMNTAGLKWGGK